MLLLAIPFALFLTSAVVVGVLSAVGVVEIDDEDEAVNSATEPAATPTAEAADDSADDRNTNGQ